MKTIAVVQPAPWGRTHKARWQNDIVAFLVFIAPLWLLLNYLALEHFGGSLPKALHAITRGSADGVGISILPFPRPSMTSFILYASWLGFQALLYAVLPGKLCTGQRTPGGHLLNYTANGLSAWVITHLLYLTAAVLGFIDPAIIARSWSGLLVTANACGLIVSMLALVKAYCAPSHPEDAKFSGSPLFDFWAGIELNPRLGDKFDVKFFFNGRPGIVAWTLIDISWAAFQYQTLGHVTASMLIVLILHTLYVVDFFKNEDWYTRTIDITHDHFGFMLAWGDTAFLPAFYTLQSQYLARYPVYLGFTQSAVILGLGLTGYAIFRLANFEKDYVRARDGNVTLWGQSATFIRASYITKDGKHHSSVLLTSGMWGLCRHSNYTGDLVLSFAMCAACGFKHILPWSYFIYMFVLLCHRITRCEAKCQQKYGDKWTEYCRTVPYRLVPGLY